MTQTLTAYTGARIFDGETWHDDAALVVADGVMHTIGDAPTGATRVPLDGGVLAPGLIDLQVNGGGGHLVGPGTTADDLGVVCATHRAFGVTGLLPTLITDTGEVTDAVLAAGAEAARRQVPGFLGLHLEGPHPSAGSAPDRAHPFAPAIDAAPRDAAQENPALAAAPPRPRPSAPRR